MNDLEANDLVVFLNDNAKRVSARLKRALERLLPQLKIYSAQTLEEGRRQVREALDSGYRRIICGGGDGTMVHILNFIREYIDEKNAQLQDVSAEVRAQLKRLRWPKIGILKLGTGNGWAGDVGSRRALPDLQQLHSECDVQTTSFNLVESENRLFHFSGLGYDAAILNDYMLFKQQFGRGPLSLWFKTLGGYLTSMILKTIPEQLMQRKTPQVRVTRGVGEIFTVDKSHGVRPVSIAPGETLYEGPVKVIGAGTTTSYGWGLRAFPYARHRPGFFNFRVITAGVVEMLAHALPIWRGMYEAPSFRDFIAQDVMLEFDRYMPFQVGGESVGYRDRVHYRISDTSVDVYAFQPA